MRTFSIAIASALLISGASSLALAQPANRVVTNGFVGGGLNGGIGGSIAGGGFQGNSAVSNSISPGLTQIGSQYATPATMQAGEVYTGGFTSVAVSGAGSAAHNTTTNAGGFTASTQSASTASANLSGGSNVFLVGTGGGGVGNASSAINGAGSAYGYGGAAAGAGSISGSMTSTPR